jgi:hypothetical protein
MEDEFKAPAYLDTADATSRTQITLNEGRFLGKRTSGQFAFPRAELLHFLHVLLPCHVGGVRLHHLGPACSPQAGEGTCGLAFTD